MKLKMQKLMRDTIEESAKGMKDAKQDLAVQDILAEGDKAEDIKEYVEEEDPPEDDFEHPPHGYELEENSECDEEKDKQNEPENEEEDVHKTEKVHPFQKWWIILRNLKNIKSRKLKNVKMAQLFGQEATDKSLQAVTEDANNDQKKEETITNREKNQSDGKSDKHDVGGQSGKSEEYGKKLEKEEATDKSLQSITKDENDDQKKEETRTNSEKNQRD